MKVIDKIKEILGYKDEINRLKSNLMEMGNNLTEQRHSNKELSQDILMLKKDVLQNSIENLIRNNVSSKDIYNIIKPLDKEGWNLLSASEDITCIDDVYSHFITEDARGDFAGKNGYQTIKYVEIAKFGEKAYYEKGSYEFIDLKNTTIDYSSKDYKDYQNKLYPEVIKKIINDPENIPTKEFPDIISKLADYKSNIEIEDKVNTKVISIKDHKQAVNYLNNKYADQGINFNDFTSPKYQSQISTLYDDVIMYEENQNLKQELLKNRDDIDRGIKQIDQFESPLEKFKNEIKRNKHKKSINKNLNKIGIER